MLVNSLPFSNIRSANSFFGWPFSTSKARRCFASDGAALFLNTLDRYQNRKTVNFGMLMPNKNHEIRCWIWVP